MRKMTSACLKYIIQNISVYAINIFLIFSTFDIIKSHLCSYNFKCLILNECYIYIYIYIYIFDIMVMPILMIVNCLVLASKTCYVAIKLPNECFPLRLFHANWLCVLKADTGVIILLLTRQVFSRRAELKYHYCLIRYHCQYWMAKAITCIQIFVGSKQFTKLTLWGAIQNI